MSVYRTIASDYYIVELNDKGNIMAHLVPTDPLYNQVLDKMVKDFNEARLEQYMGGKLKGRVKSIRMKRLKRVDEEERPYIRISVETHPGTVRLTKKIRGIIDDYITAQFCDGWGESVFYPMSWTIAGRSLSIM